MIGGRTVVAGSAEGGVACGGLVISETRRSRTAPPDARRSWTARASPVQVGDSVENGTHPDHERPSRLDRPSRRALPHHPPPTPWENPPAPPDLVERPPPPEGARETGGGAGRASGPARSTRRSRPPHWRPRRGQA